MPSSLRLARRASCAVLAAACELSACRPNVSIGSRTCSEDGRDDAALDQSVDASPPIAPNWSTDFENRFCDYRLPGGYCYPDLPGLFEIVTSPHRSGQHAAAFKVTSDDDTANQARCVRQGALPSAAYYSAYYYVPGMATVKNGNWNLFHFNGGVDWDHIEQLLDVSLVNAKSGGLQLALYGPPNHAQIGSTATAPAIRIGDWFRIQLFVEHTTGTRGNVRLYQDDETILDVTNVVIGDWILGQWYVGNWAMGVVPANSTVYVDDVSISATQ